MDRVKNVPEIRFKGFDKEWEEELLKDNVEFYSGLTYKPLDVSKKSSSNVLVIRSSNIKNGKFLLNNDDVYVKEEALNSTQVKMNDIAVVVRNGSRSLIGKHGIINKPLRKATVGAFMTGIRAYRFNFINSLLDTDTFKNQIDENMGATINQITNSTFNSMSFYFPNSGEQTQIGSFFKNLDEKLELEKEKHEKLINYKKAMLEDMFPKEGESVPKVRFDGFDDEWGFEAIKNLFYKKSAKSKVEHMIDNGKFLIMDMGSVSEVGNNISCKRTNCAEDIIDEEGLVMPKDDIGGGKIIGRTAYVDQENKYVLSDHVYLLYKLTENIIPLFAHYQINSSNFNKKIKRITTGSAQLGISWTNVGEEQIRIPSPEEQVLIGNIFKNLDEKIELSEKKIEKIENFKKAMLEKMFV